MTTPLTAADFAAVVRLLQASQLPTQDLTASAMPAFLGIREGQRLTGVIGVERYGTTGLLRSLAVASDCHSRGLGRQLVGALEQSAKAQGMECLVLLTPAAQAFFHHLGYVAVPRADVVGAVRQSAEFQSLCPGSAVCMTKTIVKAPVNL